MLSKKLGQGILSAFIRVIRVIRDSETKIRAIRIIRVSKTKSTTQKQTQIQTNNPHTGILSAFIRGMPKWHSYPGNAIEHSYR